MTINTPPVPHQPAKASQIEESLEKVREALFALRFGSVAIMVHEGRIVQIDVTEKKRLTSS